MTGHAEPLRPPDYGLFEWLSDTGGATPSTIKGVSVNRKELVAAVAESADLEQKTVDAVLRGLQSTLESAAAKGEKVSVPGFFALAVGHRAQREGRNPATGDTITIPAANTVKLTPGSALKEAANK
jgi:DNA-binding protein HU-beta